jgi:hypothetical protein
MPRTRCRPRPSHAQTLKPVSTQCPECGHRLDFDYVNYRTVTTLDAVTRLTLQIRRCPRPGRPRYHQPFRPEAEPHFALPVTRHQVLPGIATGSFAAVARAG